MYFVVTMFAWLHEVRRVLCTGEQVKRGRREALLVNELPRRTRNMSVTVDEEIERLLDPQTASSQDTSLKPAPCFARPESSLGNSNDIRVKQTVCYIVCGMMYRTVQGSGKAEVLLVQEAKPECAGKWYMPAGRMESGETIEEGVKREVEEESGLKCDVGHLIGVEVQGGGWYRFTFLCSHTGGELKTTDQADKESLQAQWFPVSDVLERKINYRAKDMFLLVEEGEKCYQKTTSGSVRIIRGLNSTPVPGMFLRLLILQKTATKLEVLVNKDSPETKNCCMGKCGKCESHRLPIVEYSLNHFVPVVISKFYRELVESGAGTVHIPSVCIGIDSHPIPAWEHDGLCLTLLCVVKPKMNAQPANPDRFIWHCVEDANLSQTINQLQENGPRFYLL